MVQSNTNPSIQIIVNTHTQAGNIWTRTTVKTIHSVLFATSNLNLYSNWNFPKLLKVANYAAGMVSLQCNIHIHMYVGSSWLSTGQDFMRSIYLHENASVVHMFVVVIDIATADYGEWSHPESRLWRILLEIADHLKVHNCFPDSHIWDGNKKTILRPFSVLLRSWWISWTRCRDLSDPATTV